MGQLFSPLTTSIERKPQITHVIFDLDGTLMDSEEQYFKLQVECLAKYGKTFGLQEKRALLGKTTDEEINSILKIYDLKNVTLEEYRALYETNYEKFFSECPALPGVDRLIQHLYQAKIPIAICTNSTTLQYDIKMRHYPQWRQMISTSVIAASDPEVKNPKPAPDPYLITMNRFNVKPRSPKNVLVFEDSLTGVRSALEAGTTVIMIPQKHFDAGETHEQVERLRPNLAAVLNSMMDFEPEKFGLPPFN